MINFYYGMSGSLKSTTINERANCNNGDLKLYSQIKLWKDLETGIFKDKVEINDLNYALSHLCSLKSYVKMLDILNYDVTASKLYVERGVSDMLFYKNLKTPLSEDFIKSVIDKEAEICCSSNWHNVNKILMIMEDRLFIENQVLKEPHRKTIFKDVDDYLTKQEEYVKFTEKYNKLTSKIRIFNAPLFIKAFIRNDFKPTDEQVKKICEISKLN